MRAARLRTIVWPYFILASCGGSPEIALSQAGSDASVDASDDVSRGNSGNTDASFFTDDAAARSADVSIDMRAPDSPLAVCGDMILQSVEQCDDGNTKPGDGCSGICTIEPGYTCKTPGKACEPLAAVCGNGKIEVGEACDDSNAKNADGCSASCQVEAGWECAKPAQPCTKTQQAAKCGDSVVQSGEQCDDGNIKNADGCNAGCQREQGWNCPIPGKACEVIAYCGDGLVQKDRGETCDDANQKPSDGCSGVCTLEPGYACPNPGKACVSIWVCGNGRVDPGESCDDGNTKAGDGCSANCTTVEAGWTCPKGDDGTGGPCVQTPEDSCGDAKLGPAEQCDDGNTKKSDGCSDTCVAEPGYTCTTVGQVCTRVAFCADGSLNLNLGEECDDGGSVAGDGCSPLCTLEPNYVCPIPGQPCVSTVVCGDSKIAGGEQCDDGNMGVGDGCGATCLLESGWTCPIPGGRCLAAQCGDGIVAGAEECDYPPGKAVPGCSPTCRIEAGFDCNPTTLACTATKCGDATVSRGETCEDGNSLPFDGCDNCQLEPSCTNGVCKAACGDGQRFATEECDDGNARSGDGCSSTCKLETGYKCVDIVAQPATTVTLPVLIRDFVGKGNQLAGAMYHEDFNQHGGSGVVGIVTPNLGTDGRPVYNCPGGDCSMNPGHLYIDGSARPNTSTQANFDQWYRNTTNVNLSSVFSLTLQRKANGTYQYDSADPAVNGGINYFDPVGTGGWVAAGKEQRVCDPLRNCSFSSETHFWFEYQGAERFDFAGDDDTWVFLNGKLAIDLGGLHTPRSGYFALNADPDGVGPAKADGKGTTWGEIDNVTRTNFDFGLVPGGVYEAVMFQAERNQCGSNFKVTLKDFSRPKSSCESSCGDGTVASNEVCDEGTQNGSGYGHCSSSCTLGPRCGDASVHTPQEECDDGTNLALYGGAKKACGPGCKWAPYCGDGVPSNGEQCDNATANNTGEYGKCGKECTLGPRCGDGLTNGPEQCDDGVNNGSTASKCSSDCSLKCGNGKADPGEQCDNGLTNNTGGYGKCNADCTVGPYCGDGVKSNGEQCDDGKNDGSYGTCQSNCTLAAYCGDEKVINPPESCDQGANNSASSYGKTACTNHCTPAPYCGDKAVDGLFNEVCDDGTNGGAPGSCSADCKAFVPLQSCGDGKVQAPEQCDDGSSNGSLQSKCDARCRLKCGNGIKDVAEQCDNGVNDGSYGTCNADCTLPGYCGDGIKNGNEQCDSGNGNVSYATAYGSGICTTVCQWAPFCGDGRVQSASGEQCDGNTGCDSRCKWSVPR